VNHHIRRPKWHILHVSSLVVLLCIAGGVGVDCIDMLDLLMH
jgi:hypothetical protein